MAVSHRKSLNSGQLAVLDLVCKFRFVSIELLRTSLGLKNNSGLAQKLKILLDQEYIAKHYEPSYRLQGRPAAYYILPKGMRALRAQPDHEWLTDGIIKASYKDKSVQLPLIEHTLTVYGLSFELKKLFKDQRVFMKRVLAGFEMFKPARPDMYTVLNFNPEYEPLRCWVDYIEDNTPRYLLDRKIRDYVTHFEEGNWDVSGHELPTMLFICDSAKYEKRLQRMAAKKLESLGSYEPLYYTTNRELLQNATRKKQAIWTNAEDTDEVYSLSDIYGNE